MEDLRACSRDSCKPKNIISASTVKCFSCSKSSHLPCYGVDKPTIEVFTIKNIVFLCDECLNSGSFVPSPKRKVSVSVTSNHNTPRNLNNLIISDPIKLPTSDDDRLELLKSSVDLVLSKIDLNSKVLDEINSRMTSKSLKSNPAMGDAASTSVSYASVVNNNMNDMHWQIASHKRPKTVINRNAPSGGVTPRKPTGIPGKASATIGKPLSPKAPPKKSIWISRLHRDTTETDILTYVNDILGVIATKDQISIRKLVKKDREITSYSFVSFRITCTLDFFNTLFNVEKWPSSVVIREFEITPKESGVELGKFLVNNDRSSTASMETKSARQSKNVENSTVTIEDIVTEK